MFPNFRLLLAATFACVVTLSFGFAIFAALRVNHEPLSQLATGTASLQLVDDEAAAPQPVWGARYGSTARPHEAVIGARGRTAQMPQPVRFWEVRPADVAPKTSSDAIQSPVLAPAPVQAAPPKKAQTASAANRIAAPTPVAPVASAQKASVEPGSSAGGTAVAARAAASVSAQQQPLAKAVAAQAPPAKTQSDSGTVVGSNKKAIPAPVSAPKVAATAPTSAIAVAAPATQTVAAKRTDGGNAVVTEKTVSPANRHTEVATAAPHAAAADASARPRLVRRIRPSPFGGVVRKPVDGRRRIVTKTRAIRRVRTRAIARSRGDSTFDEPVFISAPNFQAHTGSGRTANVQAHAGSGRTAPSVQPTASYGSPNDE